MEVDRVKAQIELSNEQLLKEFVRDAAIRGLTEETIRSYRGNMKIFLKFLNKSALEIETKDLKEFLYHLRKEKHLTDGTINMYFCSLFSFYDYLEIEGLIEKNPIPNFRKRYLKNLRKTYKHGNLKRKLITIDEMRKLVDSIVDPRDKAIVVLLAKTGIRRKELINIDIDDINWIEQSIRLKCTPKRTNTLVFFDDECARVLKRWILVRNSTYVNNGCKALFLGERGERLQGNGVYNIIQKYAKRIGLYDENSKNLEDHFGPHCFRHWFTTYLLRNGMPREYVKELRGDSRLEAVDMYHHIDREDLRESYLACIPKLGI